jgi:hypothetical protein
VAEGATVVAAVVVSTAAEAAAEASTAARVVATLAEPVENRAKAAFMADDLTVEEATPAVAGQKLAAAWAQRELVRRGLDRR